MAKDENDREQIFASLAKLSWKKTGFTFPALDLVLGKTENLQVSALADKLRSDLTSLGLAENKDLDYAGDKDFKIQLSPEGLTTLRIVGDKALTMLAENGVNFPGASDYIGKMPG